MEENGLRATVAFGWIAAARYCGWKKANGLYRVRALGHGRAWSQALPSSWTLGCWNGILCNPRPPPYAIGF